MRHAGRYAKFQVYIANTKETDAKAFPGGSIVVTTGLIVFAGSEAALVGVLGHEMSHIDHGHQLRMARATKLAQQGWEQGINNPKDMQRQIRLMTRNFARPYRPEDEAAADRDGATWAFALGYEPLELAKLFERLDKLHGRAATENRTPVPAFLRTHPSYRSRFAMIQEWTAKLAADRPASSRYVGRVNLERRIQRAVREFPE